MKNQKLSIFLLFLFIILSWGFAWPINKTGLNYLTPAWYTAIRLIVGTVTMMIIVLLSDNFKWPTYKDLPLILIIGLLQISFYILLANIGLSYLPAGRSSLLAYTTPLWVMPVAILFFNEKNSILRWVGFILGMVGLTILLSPWEMDWNDRNVITGSFMLILASMGWAISILCTRYMRWTKTPIQLVPWQLLAGTLPIIMYAIIKEPVITVTWHPTLFLSLLYTGILVTGLSYWSGIVVNKALPASVLSLGFLAVPVFSLMISALFLQEVITITTGIAMTLIIVGLACTAV